MKIKESLQFLTPLVLAANLRIFFAEKGDYGFITDETGSSVLTFGLDGIRLHFGGQYSAVNRGDAVYIGQGWQIADYLYPENSQDIKTLFAQSTIAPQWATRGKPVTIKTLEQYLKTYQRSSRFIEVIA